MNSRWSWDPNRNSYYHWSHEENASIYQDGLKLAFDGSTIATGEPMPADTRYWDAEYEVPFGSCTKISHQPLGVGLKDILRPNTSRKHKILRNKTSHPLLPACHMYHLP